MTRFADFHQYFTLSGLNTDLGLLNSGVIWGYTILICVVAWTGKFFGAGAAARFLKFSWRESGAIGMLMSCKGYGVSSASTE
jgi:Kef-type K+ transport system membrane component KefB